MEGVDSGERVKDGSTTSVIRNGHRQPKGGWSEGLREAVSRSQFTSWGTSWVASASPPSPRGCRVSPEAGVGAAGAAGCGLLPGVCTGGSGSRGSAARGPLSAQLAPSRPTTLARTSLPCHPSQRAAAELLSVTEFLHFFLSCWPFLPGSRLCWCVEVITRTRSCSRTAPAPRPRERAGPPTRLADRPRRGPPAAPSPL